MMSMFLSETEIQDLTRSRQITKQINWLKDNSFVFHIGFDGNIVILRSHVELKLAGTGSGELSHIRVEPNEGRLKQRMSV